MWYVRDRFASTVFTLMNSRSATSRFVMPSAASRATCVSVGVSVAGAGARPPIRASSLLAFAVHCGAGSSTKMSSASCSSSRDDFFCLIRRRTAPATRSVRPCSKGCEPRRANGASAADARPPRRIAARGTRDQATTARGRREASGRFSACPCFSNRSVSRSAASSSPSTTSASTSSGTKGKAPGSPSPIPSVSARSG